MKISNHNSDSAALKELGSRIARQRLNQNLTQAKLAEEAGVSTQTVLRIEQGRSTQITNFIRVMRALKQLGNLDMVIVKQVISPMQMIKTQGKVRRRASKQAEGKRPAADWVWGDEK